MPCSLRHGSSLQPCPPWPGAARCSQPSTLLTPSETRPLGLSGVPDRGQGTDLAKQTLHDSGATLRTAGTTGQLPLVSVILEPTQAYRTAMEERRREASCTQFEGGDDQEKSLGRTPPPHCLFRKRTRDTGPKQRPGEGFALPPNIKSSSQGYGEWGREGPQAAARPARILVLPLQRCDQGQVSFQLYASISLNKKEAREAI